MKKEQYDHYALEKNNSHRIQREVFYEMVQQEAKTSNFFLGVLNDFSVQITSPNQKQRLKVIENRIIKLLSAHQKSAYYLMDTRERFACDIRGGNAHELLPKIYDLLITLRREIWLLQLFFIPKSIKYYWLLSINTKLKNIVDLANRYRGRTFYC